MIMKKCTKCNQNKIDDANYFCKNTKGGITNLCKVCKSFYDKERRDFKKNAEREKFEGLSEEEKLKVLEEKENLRKISNERSRTYKRENKEKIKNYNKIYRNNNTEKQKLNLKAWNEKNKEHVKKYRIENRDRDRETARNWYHSLNGNLLSITRTNRRRANKKLLASNFTVKQWNSCKEYFENKCAYCGKASKLEQEHFVPLAKKGEYTILNILPSCRTCNASKSDNVFEEWYENYEFYAIERLNRIKKYFKEVN